MTESNEARALEDRGPRNGSHSGGDGGSGKRAVRARILLLDDDSTIRRSYGEDFEDAGFEVDRAETTAQALQFLLANPTYDAVFVDIMLGKNDEPGDKFILNNLQSLRGPRVTAITAETNHIDQGRITALESANIDIIYKTPGFRPRLIEVVEEQIVIRDQPSPRIEPGSNSKSKVQPIDPPTNIQKPALMSMLEQVLLDWLRSRSEPTKKRVYYAGRLYSYSDIATEIERGTELGNAHLKMMANLFKRQMNLE